MTTLLQVKQGTTLPSQVLLLNERINRLRKRISRQPSNQALCQRLTDLLAWQEAALLDTSAIHQSLDDAAISAKSLTHQVSELTRAALAFRQREILFEFSDRLFTDPKVSIELIRELAEIEIALESL